jgi:large subunit ribosomal protein L35e
MVQVKAVKLREKSRTDLLTQLEELKKELATLRVSKVTGTQANKLSKMYVAAQSEFVLQ